MHRFMSFYPNLIADKHADSATSWPLIMSHITWKLKLYKRRFKGKECVMNFSIKSKITPLFRNSARF